MHSKVERKVGKSYCTEPETEKNAEKTETNIAQKKWYHVTVRKSVLEPEGSQVYGGKDLWNRYVLRLQWNSELWIESGEPTEEEDVTRTKKECQICKHTLFASPMPTES